eukprot:CAMPEP_0174333856 /NCGR_PEP_ID=MMETSP0810-20121108/19474_1 /TAXON_ID=73025 ORGANISM="Eutreptiella gymnastica-like, Strain CCMP1594" /NCGR_SAMPLE_ID=MMETSP0810 /ASSEMBLY_ACC=CAM_ASM_000659 /LENGTH=47 /DNA_ID= /DNA_START= /DNA_END= /DNA_ORIENTATION=
MDEIVFQVPLAPMVKSDPSLAQPSDDCEQTVAGGQGGGEGVTSLDRG